MNEIGAKGGMGALIKRNDDDDDEASDDDEDQDNPNMVNQTKNIRKLAPQARQF